MAKRKSKSGKQKQTKKKTGSILAKNGSKRKSGTANGTSDIRILCSLPKPRTNKQHCNGLHRQPSSLHNSNNNNNSNEKADFDRQMNSLVERSKAVDASTNRRKYGRRRKHPESKLLKNAMVLKPASFSLEKSTNQLMEETMHQMGQIMSSSSSSSNNNNNSTNNSVLSALSSTTTNGSSLARAAAAIPSSERTPIISNASHRTSFSTNPNNIAGIAGIENNSRRRRQQQQNQQQQIRNSFLALDTGNSSDENNDDDDNNESNAEIARANTTIRFAPAAFSLQDSSRTSSSTPSLLLPTKTPPTTPSSTPNHHFLRSNKRATSLFATINEEEIEELHYQRQMGKAAATAAANMVGAVNPHSVSRHLENIQQATVADNDEVDDDL